MRPYTEGNRLDMELNSLGYLMHGSYRDCTTNYSMFDVGLEFDIGIYEGSDRFRKELNMADFNKLVYFKGPVRWAKIFEGNRDKGDYAPEGGQYTIDIGLDADNTKVVKGWNRLYQGKKDGKLTYFQFKRKHEHLNGDGDVIVQWSGPPTVMAEDKVDWGNSLIGNGSICTVKLAVNKVGSKTFVRLEGVRVDEHVEYEGEERPPAEVENLADGIPF